MKNSTVRKLDSPLDLDASDQELLKQVIDYYNETLKQSPDALEYRESRGLKSSENSSEMIERFTVRWPMRIDR